MAGILSPPAVPANFVTAVYVPDTLRNPLHQPGRLVYSAQFDREKLQCLYTALLCPYICKLDDILNQTSVDVYTNGILFTTPDSCGIDFLCCRHPIGRFRYFDQTAFNSPTYTGTVFPFCNLCALLGCLGKFGEQANFHASFINTLKPSGLSHITSGCFPCFTVESIYGLKEGEGARLAGIINEQVRLFKENSTNYGIDPVAAAGGAKMA